MVIPPDENNYNTFDKLKFEIPSYMCEIPPNAPDTLYFNGGCYKQRQGNTLWELSGKFFAAPASLGLFDKDNMLLIPNELYKRTEWKINTNYFLNEAPLYTVHITKDISLDGNISDYISEMREILRCKSDKYEITKYADLKYQYGLALIPKTQANYRFIIYNKGMELRKLRNKDYREQFDYKFLEELNKIVRFEYQIKDFRRMRKEFGIPEWETPTIAGILRCKRNIVSDFMNELLS